MSRSVSRPSTTWQGLTAGAGGFAHARRVVSQPADVVGPVQLVLIGLPGRTLPTALAARIEELHAGQAVNVLDYLFVHSDPSRGLVTEQVAALNIACRAEQGAIIDSILQTAMVARTMGETTWPGPAYMFRADILPDPRQEVPRGRSAFALLLEHCWAIDLRETAADDGTSALVNGWLGRPLLRELGLLSEDGR